MKNKKIVLKQKHFDYFKKCCNYYIDKFKLDSWSFFFHQESQNGSMAKTRINYVDQVATVILAETWNSIGIFDLKKEIKNTAKHEIIHVLIGRFAGLVNSRHVGEDEMTNAEESLVIKLSSLL